MYCLLTFKHRGQIKTWAVDAHPQRDNLETLKAHLGRWIPDSEFLQYRMGEFGVNLPIRTDAMKEDYNASL